MSVGSPGSLDDHGSRRVSSYALRATAGQEPTGEALPIELSANATEEDVRIEIQWTGTQTQTASWAFGLNLENPAMLVAEASHIEENPFAVIPFRHNIRTSAGSSDPIDLIVVSSNPCRIEYYDTELQRPLAVDVLTHANP